MTDEELKAIEQRAAAATPGLWEIVSDNETGAIPIVCGVTPYGEFEYLIDDVATLRDAAFISAARSDVPALVDEVQKLRPLADFGREVLEWVIANEFWNDMCGDDFMPLAQKYGLAQRVPYDPAKHGEVDADEGAMIWWIDAAKLDTPPAVEASAAQEAK